MFGRARHGLVCHGWARHGRARQGFKARIGGVVQGLAWPGVIGQGFFWVWRCWVRRGELGSGSAPQGKDFSRLGHARWGESRQGKARSGVAMRGEDFSWLGPAWLATPGLGTARSGAEGQGFFKARRRRVWRGWPWLGWAMWGSVRRGKDLWFGRRRRGLEWPG